MTDGSQDNILDGLFHNCALVAFVEQAISSQDWPDARLTQDRANRLYEQALARKHASASG